MNKRIFKTIVLAAALTLSAFAGKRTTSGPTINTSCSFCTTDAVAYFGNGYKAGVNVQIDIQGPVSYTITAYVDSTGSIYVDNGTSLAYPAGTYNVTASTVSGKTITPVAYTSFTAQ